MTTQLARVKAVLEQHPDLSRDGFRFDIYASGSPYSNENFPENRAALLNPWHQEQIATVCEFLKQDEIRKRDGSYGLKHAIERWGNEAGLCGYITNGCAIVGALLSGYTVVREKNSPNCRFKKL